MKTRLLNIWEKLRSTFWFLPASLTLGAVGLSFALVALDNYFYNRGIPFVGVIQLNQPAGARLLLSTVAGSMITVAGVVFSITIVALSLAAGQYGPRLLRNFMRDTGNQFVLGTFVATFVYCLLVLRTIRGEITSDPFIPHFSLTFGLVLGLLSLGVLIYFFHHVSESLLVSNLISDVGKDLDHAIERLFPEKVGSGEGGVPEEITLPAMCANEPLLILARETGFVQAIDSDGIISSAIEHGILIQVCCRPGDFVVQGFELAKCWPAESVDESFAEELSESAFIIGNVRTTEQDAMFPLNQLVEITLKALSPGINDPFTAISAIRRIGAGLCDLAERQIPSALRYDDEGQLRVVAEPVTFEEMAEAAFTNIRMYACSNLGVVRALFESLYSVAQCLRRHDDAAALVHHASMIWQESERGLRLEQDRQEVEYLHKQFVSILERHFSELEQPEPAVQRLPPEQVPPFSYP